MRFRLKPSACKYVSYAPDLVRDAHKMIDLSVEQGNLRIYMIKNRQIDERKLKTKRRKYNGIVFVNWVAWNLRCCIERTRFERCGLDE